MQDIEADMHKAKLESEGQLAAMRKELLAAEDRERAELEHEYRQATQAWDTVRATDLSAWTFILLADTATAYQARKSALEQKTSAYQKQCCTGLCSTCTADPGLC